MQILRKRSVNPWVLGAVVLVGHAGASAQSNPLTLILSQSVSTDNNFLRRPDGGPSDTTSVTNAGLIFNKALGRQIYSAKLSMSASRHHEFKDYDFDGYNLSLGASSGVGSKGYVSLQHSRNKTQQSPDAQTGLRFNDTVNSNATSLFTQYGVNGRIGVNANLVSSSTTYSRNFANNTDSVGLRVGGSYSPSDLLSLGVGVRRTDQTLPAADDKTTRYDIDANSSWVVTGYSTLAASLASSRQKRSRSPEADFNGLTGNLNWGYTPGGKISYALSLSRDIANNGQPTQFYASQQTPGVISAVLTNQVLNQLTTTISGTTRWAITQKVNANFSASYQKFEDSRSQDIIGSVSGLDQLLLPNKGRQVNLSLGGDYQAARWMRLGCSLASYKREGQRASVLGYQGQTLGCDANFTLN